ncbi:MAG: helix-turn-helix transcriptional regulator [Clostridia bacterium]|nr:helix-turn-helix transcriptional regulator [Clostridia bacterium]
MASAVPQYVFTKPIQSIVVDEIITIFYFEETPKFKFDGESHDFWELMYIDHGTLIVNPNTNEEKILKAGQAILYPPNFFHSHRATGHEPVNLIIVTFTCKASQLHQIANRVFSATKSQIKYINRIISEAPKAFSSPLNFFVSCELIRKSEQTFGAEQLIQMYLQMLLISVIRKDTANNSDIQTTMQEMTDNERANKIINYLHDNLYRHITFTDICNHTQLSPTSIKKLFRNATGTTVMHYYIDMKVTEAKKLIRQGRFTISEVSEALCYSSIQHFSKQFHTKTGYTPTQYAATLQAHNDPADKTE